MPTDNPSLQDSRNMRARTMAQAATEGLQTRPGGSVSYVSRGRVLIIGGEEAQWLAARVQSPMHAQVLLTAGAEEPGVPATSVGGRPLVLSGYLGAFRTELGEKGRPNYEVLDSDLVVDLSDEAIIDSQIPPPGYWHFGREPADLDAATLAIDGMTGTFEKPRYFAYDPNTCAHARSGQPGCSRCIEACPADAIISIGEQVEVNPNLCQGGGICATVCPTGAMRYAYPGPADTAERVRVMLTAYEEGGGTDPVVMFASAEDAADLPATPPNVLLVPLEELASAGHEIWLAALAWGARCVVLVDGGSVPGKAADALAKQVSYCHALLEGLNVDAAALRLANTQDLAGRCVPVEDLPTAAQFAATGDKRQLAGMALDYLWAQSPQSETAFALPAGAPYGQLAVDEQRCTLCMACTSVCPAKALSAGDETPRLDFYESNCVQCGICASACPEGAIALVPRYLADPEQRRRPVTLNEEPPFCCVQCGKPFATRRVIDNILDKLAGHAMFTSDRARKRLQMCEDCRVVDAVQDTEAMQAGLSVQTNDNAKKGQ